MKDHFCVIMSGGIGARFWPFSRTHLPKQFLDLFGTGRSLLQMTVDRFRKIIPLDQIYIVTNEMYDDIMAEQLPELNRSQFLYEPQRRNTAPCIAWACHHIKAINANASIVVAPSDHLIMKEEEFMQTIQKGLDFVSKEPILLTLGIKPTRPETGYGYIQIEGDEQTDFHKVKTFTEKPNVELAKVFYESGEFFWNSGLFLWNVQTILDAFEAHLPQVNHIFLEGSNTYGTDQEAAFITEHFARCANISIDYGIMEKSNNAYMLGADIGWSDLGTWGSLFDISEKDEHNNAALKCKLIAYESKDNIVTLADGKLAVIQGLDGYIVAESDNVLLICPQEEEQNIRQFVADAKLQYGDDFV